jgi:type II restriction enzyme
MTLNLVNYRQRVQEAVQFFWNNREAARQKQIAAGTVDQGERAGVTSGKNMDGFIDLLVRLTQANGLAQAEIHQKRAILSLPGYFRPTKL